MATIMYPIKTTLAMMAAEAPAYVELPLKIALRLTKYVEMGTVTSRKVKRSNFAITEPGTAGRMSDGPSGTGWLSGAVAAAACR